MQNSQDNCSGVNLLRVRNNLLEGWNASVSHWGKMKGCLEGGSLHHCCFAVCEGSDEKDLGIAYSSFILKGHHGTDVGIISAVNY